MIEEKNQSEDVIVNGMREGEKQIIKLTERLARRKREKIVTNRKAKQLKALNCFELESLPQPLREITEPFREVARKMSILLEGEEFEHSLKKLIELKECMIRARVAIK